jgi:hypothetical protein
MVAARVPVGCFVAGVVAGAAEATPWSQGPTAAIVMATA